MTELPKQPEIDSHERAGRFMHPENARAVDRDLFGNPPRGRPDWSHRRGEPRVLALFWMIYLMLATVVMFSSMSKAHSINPDITRPATRTMLLVVSVGLFVLWPMVRLSQQHLGGGHVRFVLRDAIVLFLPLQAVIWPHVAPMLANWSVPVVAHLALFYASWLLLLAGVLALAMGSIERNGGRTLPRTLWTIVVLLVAFGAPLVAAVSPPAPASPADQPRIGWLLSPISGVYEIVRDRAEIGIAARVYAPQTRMLIANACVGLAMLLIARALEVARARVRA